jgi:hypothetical protein
MMAVPSVALDPAVGISNGAAAIRPPSPTTEKAARG